MRVRYISQPDESFGTIILQLIGRQPAPRQVIIVSAFAGLQTVMRLKAGSSRGFDSAPASSHR
jgi:hypothetical protein